ncbi:MAG: hypothetical protein QM664_08460 [Flavihumibacter sp.]
MIFVLVNLGLRVFADRLATAGVDRTVIQVGNLVLFLVFWLSLVIRSRGTADPKSPAFLTPVYAGMMLKFFGLAIAAFFYIYFARDQVNKPALFVCMGLYLVYSLIELAAQRKPNA